MHSKTYKYKMHSYVFPKYTPIKEECIPHITYCIMVPLGAAVCISLPRKIYNVLHVCVIVLMFLSSSSSKNKNPPTPQFHICMYFKDLI